MLGRLAITHPATGAAEADRSRPCRAAAVVWFCGLLLGWHVAADVACGMDSQEAIEAAGEALGGRGDFPWYDRQEDALRRIPVEPPREPAAHRGSTWQAQPPAERDYSWLQSLLRGVGEVLRWLLWGGLLALLLLLVFLLARAFTARETAGDGSAEADQWGPAGAELDRIEELPFQVRMPQTDLLSEARRYYEAGDYGQAIVYLFSYKLLALDRHGLIRVNRGKTNRQYLAELPPQPSLRQMLQRTMEAFEDVFFGQHRLERDRFEACWRELDDFHAQIQRAGVS